MPTETVEMPIQELAKKQNTTTTMSPHNNIAADVAELRHFFASQVTKDIDFRLAQLKKLKAAIEKNEKAIVDALRADLHKHEFETFATELILIYKELDDCIANIRRWAQPRKVGTSMVFFKASSYIISDPYGTVLIMGPWNYPFQLAILPLIGAIAAGNCVALKPSEWAPHTAKVVTQIVAEALDPRQVKVFEGEMEVGQALLAQKFDYIFFTGSTAVGRVVYEAAAKHLTPVTLELGGKSPCIVWKDADISTTVKRLMWGKLVNAGQTCIAPDYLLVHPDIKDALIDGIKKTVKDFYGRNPAKSDYYCRIINDRHFNRLVSLMQQSGQIVFGGDTIAEERYIGPTLLDKVSPDSPIMQEEIFGPILPMIDCASFDEAVRFINERPKPLALYIFTRDKALSNRLFRETSSGTGGINHTLLQIGNSNMSFGGVGESGVGGYHGEFSFNTFSHQKSIMDKSLMIETPLLYAPYRMSAKLLKFLAKKLG